MVKSPIKVIVRSRQTSNFDSNHVKIDEQNKNITINVPKTEAKGFVNHQQESWNFKFNKVLNNKSQETVFDSSAKELLKDALEGYSGTILCYGQTGAGKTYTMTGNPLKLELKGIIPRTINALFKEIQSRSNQDIVFKVSYVEIYNEIISDLLQPTSNAQIVVCEDFKKGTNMRGLSQRICKTDKEALRALLEGTVNRTASSNTINTNSSRSHAVYSIYLEMKSKDEASEQIVYSKINLVDLAGSERTKKTKSEGQTLVEANYINKSLFFLEQMVGALSEKQRNHVPYRHSKLTHLLKDSIGGNCKTIMIANVLPDASNLEETISTLKFAARMMKVSNEPYVNVKVDSQVLIKKYETQIIQLKRELTVKNESTERRPSIAKKKYTPEERRSLYKQAKKYLRGDIKKLEAESISHAEALFKQLRRAHKQMSKVKQESQTILGTDETQSTITHEITPKKKVTKVKARTSLKYMMNQSVEDNRNVVTRATTKDFSTDILNTETDGQNAFEKRPSFNMSSIQRVGEYDRLDILSQSNLFEERDLTEDLCGKDIRSPGNCRIKFMDNSRLSPVTDKEILVSREKEKRSLETKSLNYIQDLSPKTIVDEVIRTENDLKFPRRKYKFESEKIKRLQNTLDLIKQKITQANSILHKQYDHYTKRGYSVPRMNGLTEASIVESQAVNETFALNAQDITVTSSN